MISRRKLFIGSAAGAASVTVLAMPALAAAPQPFTLAVFEAAQKAGKPVLVQIHADWCPTCKAQAPIIGELSAQPKFKELVVFRVDFDKQTDMVRKFGAQMQSTLIVFKGAQEVGRSVGETQRAAISALLDKVT